MNQNVSLLELKKFIGKKANYYLEQREYFLNTGKKIKWNWSAFLFSFFWFAYRKFYKPVFFYAGLVIANFLLTLFSENIWLTPIRVLIGIIRLIAPLICGLYGTYYYLEFAEKEIMESEYSTDSQIEKQEEIAERGGTSWLLVLVVVLFTILFFEVNYYGERYVFIQSIFR